MSLEGVPSDVVEEFFPATPPELPPIGVGLHLDVSHERYMGDPCERPSLSSSVAKEIVTETPLHAWQMHPRLGGGGDAHHTAALDAGSLIHKLVLGRGQDFMIVDAKDWRTNLAKAKRTEARQQGLIPVLIGDMDEYRERAAIYVDKLAGGWGIRFDNVPTEVTAIWEEGPRLVGPDGQPLPPVLCRARFDAWRPDDLIIDDLKTARACNETAAQRVSHDFGYDVSAAHYIRGAEALVDGADGRVKMRFIFLENTPPYEPLVTEFAGSMLEVGRRKRSRAFEAWSQCIAADYWPGRRREVVRLEAAAWAVKQDTDQAFAAFENPPPSF